MAVMAGLVPVIHDLLLANSAEGKTSMPGTRPGNDEKKLRRLLLRRLVTQRAAQDLADRSLRQLVAEFDEFRPLVIGEPLRDEMLQLVLGERRIALDDECLHGLARSFVRHADHGAF